MIRFPSPTSQLHRRTSMVKYEWFLSSRCIVVFEFFWNPTRLAPCGMCIFFIVERSNGRTTPIGLSHFLLHCIAVLHHSSHILDARNGGVHDGISALSYGQLCQAFDTRVRNINLRRFSMTESTIDARVPGFTKRMLSTDGPFPRQSVQATRWLLILMVRVFHPHPRTHVQRIRSKQTRGTIPRLA